MATTTLQAAANRDALAEVHRIAEEQRAEAHAKFRRATQHRDRRLREITPHDSQPTLGRQEWLRARREVAQLEEALADLEVAAADADRREEEARAALRAARAADDDAELRRIIAKLVPLLLQARQLADRLGAIKERRSDLDVYTWPFLQTGDARGAWEPMLDVFMRSTRAYGWLD
jgi:hypothetical protein